MAARSADHHRLPHSRYENAKATRNPVSSWPPYRTLPETFMSLKKICMAEHRIFVSRPVDDIVKRD
jgi:hypothetical protein